MIGPESQGDEAVNTFDPRMTRRRFLESAGSLGLTGLLAASSWDAWAASSGSSLTLPFTNGERPLTAAFPQKGTMILQRTRPPLLETPFEVFDQGVFTPNDQFYVRWHLASIPAEIDPSKFRLKVRGHVQKDLELTLDDLVNKFERVELAAVNQCSGNSRGYFAPRVPGAQWSNGAMGNARWTGVRLKDVLDSAGVAAGAVAVRYNGLETAAFSATPNFKRSLAIDHARDGEVMIAYLMNGEPLPVLNGFPIRLVVPGWYAPYWVKMLSDIEVLDKPDDYFWMVEEYQIPDTPHASVKPGQTGFKTVPINRMVPRSFFTNVRNGAVAKVGAPLELRGIAFGGDAGVAQVKISTDGGRQWQPAQLGTDYGKYSFRQWSATVRFATPGARRVAVMAINTNGVAQPAQPNWNGGGFMRNVVETVSVQAA
jgi:DMSO/TMAO reductase YedYZ molybdopterin-dependent catalytic subunit